MLKPSHSALSLTEASNNYLQERTQPATPPPTSKYSKSPNLFQCSTDTDSPTEYTNDQLLFNEAQRPQQPGLLSQPAHEHPSPILTIENILCREPYAAAACCWVLRANAKLLALVLLLLKAGIVTYQYKLCQRKGPWKRGRDAAASHEHTSLHSAAACQHAQTQHRSFPFVLINKNGRHYQCPSLTGLSSAWGSRAFHYCYKGSENLPEERDFYK